MPPRPRKDKNKGLPPNLYPDTRYDSYRYRRPDDGTWHQMGNDKAKAIAAAKQLNAMLMPGADLVAGVLGNPEATTLGAFIKTYREDILPPRKLAKATLDLYDIRLRQMERELGESRPLDGITLQMVAAVLDALTPRPSNQLRAVMIDLFNHAVAKGKMPDNPAALTIPKIEEKQRRRHTVEGLKKIRDAAPDWLQNAIDLALITGQRREDILAMRFDDIRDGYLYVVQEKTKKVSNAAYIRFKLTPQLKAVLARCRDDVPSPFLIHRRPERLDAKQRGTKEHWTAIEERFLTRTFKEVRDAVQPYPEWSEAEQPGFHEIRALVVQLYKRAGKEFGKIVETLGHAGEKMTKNYGADHHDIVWTDVEPDLDLQQLVG